VSEEAELAALSVVWARALAAGETVVDAPPGPISSMLDRVHRAFLGDSHALETLERARRDGAQDSVNKLADLLVRYAARDGKLAACMLDFRGLLDPGNDFQYTGPGTQDVNAAGDAFVAGGREPGREPAVGRNAGVSGAPGAEPGERSLIHYLEDRSSAKRLPVEIAELLAAVLPGFFAAVRACLRVVMLAAAVAYLAFMNASHRVPISQKLGLDPLVEFGGWLVLMVVVAEAAVETQVFGREETRILRHTWSRLRSRWGLAVFGVLMMAVLVPAGVASWSAGLSFNCDTAVRSLGPACLKLDNWAESHGEYFRQYPYDAQGNSDPGAAWVRISRAEYIAEFGTYLRYSSMVDVVCLGMALALSVLEAGIVSDSRDRRRPS
jgi:hypothetical protein